MAGEIYVLEMIVFDKGGEEARDGVRARFDEARDVAQGWKTEGMHAQWWGQALEKPNAYFWFLQWRSPAQYTASLPSPLRARVFSLLPPSPSTPEPTTNPAFPSPTGTTSTPLLLPSSPDPLLRAPILEMTRFWVHDDVPTEHMVAVLAGFHAEMERLREEGVGMVGSRGWTNGFALDLALQEPEGEGQGGERLKVGKEGAHVAGWESVDDHMKLGEGDERFLAAFEDTATVVRRLEMWHMKVVPHP